jgi:hypothetical protein
MFVAGLENAVRVKQSETHLPTFDILAEAGRDPSIAKLLRDHNLALRSRFAAFLCRGQEKGHIDRSLEPDLAACVLISIQDAAKALLARDPKVSKAGAGEHLKMLIARFLRPEDK